MKVLRFLSYIPFGAVFTGFELRWPQVKNSNDMNFLPAIDPFNSSLPTIVYVPFNGSTSSISQRKKFSPIIKTDNSDHWWRVHRLTINPIPTSTASASSWLGNNGPPSMPPHSPPPTSPLHSVCRLESAVGHSVHSGAPTTSCSEQVADGGVFLLLQKIDLRICAEIRRTAVGVSQFQLVAIRRCHDRSTPQNERQPRHTARGRCEETKHYVQKKVSTSSYAQVELHIRLFIAFISCCKQ